MAAGRLNMISITGLSFSEMTTAAGTFAMNLQTTLRSVLEISKRQSATYASTK